MQGLWSRIHIEQGWENALEAALRERLGALEVSRLDMVRGFAGTDGRDTPPAKLSFYSSPAGGAPAKSNPANGLQPLADLLRLNDAGQSALLGNWLHGCYTAGSLDDALAAREKLQAGEAIYVKSGHAVTLHSVSFYAQDSEQAGLLGRAQEIENLDKQLRAQALISDEVEKFWQWVAGLAAVPVLTQFRDEMNQVRERELSAALRRLPNLTADQRAAVEHFSHALMNKFLHEPSVRLRAAAANGRGLGIVDAARYLFALDERAAAPRVSDEPPAPTAIEDEG